MIWIYALKEVVEFLIIVFVVGLALDYPEQRRKKKRKENGTFNDRH